MHFFFSSQELSDEALREELIRKHFTSRIAELNTKVNGLIAFQRYGLHGVLIIMRYFTTVMPKLSDQQ